jgi:hypothetical protein
MVEVILVTIYRRILVTPSTLSMIYIVKRNGSDSDLNPLFLTVKRIHDKMNNMINKFKKKHGETSMIHS